MAEDNEIGTVGGPTVAEYVLGVLDAEEHALVEFRIAANPALQAEMRFWQARLASLDTEFEEVAPPAATFRKIETRLFGVSRRSGPLASVWSSLALWRGLAAASVAIAALAIGFAVLQPAPQPVGAPQYVANLADAGTDVRFVAVYDVANSTLRLAGLSGAPVEGRDYELWFIEGGNAPVSLGIVPVDGRIEVPLTSSQIEKLSGETTLAVTLEPLGGAPEGIPTGPIVAAGPVTRV